MSKQNLPSSTLKKKNLLEPGLYIVATPIGNLGDITVRALDILERADVILCEDTRVTLKLLRAYDISTHLMAYHDHNASKVRPQIIDRIKSGQIIAQVSDAGTPLVSDPGFKLVQACVEENLAVTSLPGASAVLNALVLSALPSDKFCFCGFLPNKSGTRQNVLSEMKDVPATLIYYETAPRLLESLQDALTVLGNRFAVVARELTKKFEEVRRGRLSDLVAHYQEQGAPKGEIVLLYAAMDTEEKKRQFSDQDVTDMLRDAIENKGLKVKQAAALVAEATGYRKRDLYQQGVALVKDKE